MIPFTSFHGYFSRFITFISKIDYTQALGRLLNRNQLNRWSCSPAGSPVRRIEGGREGASFSLFRCFFVCFSLICQRPAECRVHANEFEPGTSDWAPGPVYLSFINQRERGRAREKEAERLFLNKRSGYFIPFRERRWTLLSLHACSILESTKFIVQGQHLHISGFVVRTTKEN